MSLGEHLAQLLGGLKVLEPMDVSLSGAHGSRLAHDVVAPRPLPHFPVCSGPGYAVRSGDAVTGATLRVVDDVAPGFTSSQPVYAGVAVAVAANTLLPKGADAVLPVGAATRSGDSLVVRARATVGAGVVAAGSVVPEGSPILPAGHNVDATAIGLLAAAGIARVSIRPQPRVVVVTVGNGLIASSGPATDGLLFDAAGPMLCATAADHGGMASRVGPVPAEDRRVRDALDDQLVRSDLIVVSGGSEPSEPGVKVHLGKSGSVLYDEGSTTLGHFGHGVLGDDRIPVLALPADPVRAAMLFLVVAVPMMRVMRGVGPVRPLTLTLGSEVQRLPGVTTLLLAKVSESGVAYPVSSVHPTVAEYADADAIIRILPGRGVMEAGSRIPAMRTRPDISAE